MFSYISNNLINPFYKKANRLIKKAERVVSSGLHTATVVSSGIVTSAAFLPLTYAITSKFIGSVAPVSANAVMVASIMSTGIISLFAAKEGVFKYTYNIGKVIGEGIHKGLYIPRKITYGMLKHSAAFLGYATAAVAMYQMVKHSGVLNNSLTPDGQASVDRTVNSAGAVMCEFASLPLIAARDLGVAVTNVAIKHGPDLCSTAGKGMLNAFEAAKLVTEATVSATERVVDIAYKQGMGSVYIRNAKV